MRACIVIAIVFAALALTAASERAEKETPNPIRHVRSPDTIFMKLPFPGCIFYECIAKCRQRGHRSGGVCTFKGCVCL